MKNYLAILFTFVCSVSFASPKLFGEKLGLGKGEVVEGVVTEVCQKKGCFMKIKAGETERFVRFKDYGFFVPKDLAGKKVKIKAVEVQKDVSVDEQKHLLSDAKAPQEKIDGVKEPLQRIEWLASGVELVE